MSKRTGSATARWCATALLAAGLLLPDDGVSQEPTAERVDVAGRVVEVATGAPVEGASVSVRGTAARAVTDRDGRFVLRGVPSGDRTWVIERLGYATWEQRLAVQHLDQLRIGLLARPVDLEAIRVTVDRLERRRNLAPYSVHTVPREALRSAVATIALDLVPSRMPWPRATCPANDDEQSAVDMRRLCIVYRGGITEPEICLDDRPVPFTFLDAYGATEIQGIDYIGGPRPEIRLYTERFLERSRPVLPLTVGCH